MAVDIKKLLEIVQKRINNLDSSTVTLQELIDIANFTDKASKGTLQFVDDSSDLPNLLNPSLPTAQSNQSLTFVKNSGRLFVKKNAWKPFSYRGLISSGGVSPVGNSPYQDATNNGYFGGGQVPSPVVGNNFMNRWPFASGTTNATSLGGIAPSGHIYAQSNSSSTYAYYTGGITAVPGPTQFTYSNQNTRMPFSSSTSFSSVGNLNGNGHWKGASNISSPTNGYLARTYTAPPGTPFGTSPVDITSSVYKFPFSASSGVTSSSVGSLTAGGYGGAGASSDTYGFIAGGGNGPVYTINKFPFSSDANATSIGNLVTATQAGYGYDGCSGPTDGYTVGHGSTPYVQIQKYSFTSDGNSSNTGVLSASRYSMSTSTSSTYGYGVGGVNTPGGTGSNIIDRFPFASDGNASDVGDLTVGKELGHGWSN